MLLSIVFVIILNKYRLTKSLGVTMFAFYIVFIVIDLLRNAGYIVVNFQNTQKNNSTGPQ